MVILRVFSLPDFDDGQTGGSIFAVDPIFGAQTQKQKPKVNKERPAYLDELKTEPQYLISCDPRELERAAENQPASPPK